MVPIPAASVRCLIAFAALGSFSNGVTAETAKSIDDDARVRVERLVTASGAEVAVAVRTLGGGTEWLRNADTRFHAASTMKLAVMVELFRQAEAGTFSLDDPLTVSNTFKSIVDGSAYSLSAADDSENDTYARVGQTLSLRELCERMITVSSNLATNLLIEKLGINDIRRTVASLGADGMDVRRGVEDSKAFAAGLSNTTDARGLLVLLDAIGHGKAVSPAASASMVAILERQKFAEGIPAGLPAGTRVAHKTGSITRIYHDAGIVYRTRPYVLVVLVRGLDDEKKAHALVAEITRVVDAAISGDDRANH